MVLNGCLESRGLSLELRSWTLDLKFQHMSQENSFLENVPIKKEHGTYDLAEAGLAVAAETELDGIWG
jgi:hypothetical protein